MNRKQRYYGMAGKNGYGVFDDYEKLLVSQKYLRSSQVKKFDDIDRAKEWALDTFMDLADASFGLCGVDEISRINWIYFVRG